MPAPSRPFRVRWGLGSENAPRAPTHVDDYLIDVACWGSWSQHFARVKIRRKTDGKVIFPFEGAAVVGPFSSAGEAREKGEQFARDLVYADIKNPE
ncbi:conserved protein of unknown function (plasmid) [Pararobbsia alpina]|uniref:DUF6723 family protein n=1 Tax=Pararobbsia alpina TaxID=621374 RepID=UPI0039A77559